jgi:hypothetical protein
MKNTAVACLAAGGAKPPKSNLTIGHYLRWCKHSNYNWIGRKLGGRNGGRRRWNEGSGGGRKGLLPPKNPDEKGDF